MVIEPGNVIIIVQTLCWAHEFIESQASNVEDSWYDFKVTFGKKYHTPEEEEMRKRIFSDNLKKIEQYNQGGRSFNLEINEFADLTSAEIPSMGNRPYDNQYGDEGGFNITPIQFEATGAILPDHVDWREKGILSPVKHQHGCLACYSFVAVEVIESQYALKYGQFLSLSQQQLIDCSKPEGNLGCKGGMVDWTYKYLLRAKGIQDAEGYPYTSKESYCKFDPSKVIASITNYGEIKNGSEVSLQEAVAFYGPISVSISSKDFAWNYYSTGIYDNPNCSTDIDHSVLVIGYGTENSKDYWLVKNSYGESFGEGGYIKMARNKGNQCAIASYANFAIIGEWKPFSP